MELPLYGPEPARLTLVLAILTRIHSPLLDYRAPVAVAVLGEGAVVAIPLMGILPVLV